jgi:hypothetical protein
MAGALRGTECIEIVGSLTSPTSIDETLAGCSTACVFIGPHPPFTDVFCAEATEAILSGMKRCSVPRIICQTGAMVGAYPANRSILFELMSSLYRKRQPAAHNDRVEQETAVKTCGLDWTIVKPPRLTMANPTPKLHAGPYVKVGSLSSVSRQDIGRLIVSELEQRRFGETTIFVRH